MEKEATAAKLKASIKPVEYTRAQKKEIPAC
jgi:hypothetical protein